ncbi:MAG: hypothetical protein WAW86_01850 [Gammaproteobacteria bacterium]
MLNRFPPEIRHDHIKSHKSFDSSAGAMLSYLIAFLIAALPAILTFIVMYKKSTEKNQPKKPTLATVKDELNRRRQTEEEKPAISIRPVVPAKIEQQSYLDLDLMAFQGNCKSKPSSKKTNRFPIEDAAVATSSQPQPSVTHLPVLPDHIPQDTPMYSFNVYCFLYIHPALLTELAQHKNIQLLPALLRLCDRRSIRQGRGGIAFAGEDNSQIVLRNGADNCRFFGQRVDVNLFEVNEFRDGHKKTKKISRI